VSVRSHELGGAYGGFDDVLGADAAPLNVGWVALAEDGDRVTFYYKLVTLDFDTALEATVSGVVLEHVGLVEC
jgi:hypothetical protein